MKGKLIKNIDYYPNDIMIYYSLIINEECIGTTHDLFNNEMTYKLSLKNCQAIERGYDLDELAKRHHKLAYIQAYNPDIAPYVEADYKAGFQKALEILGDKKFTEEDMMNCWNEALTFKIHKKTFREFIQSLQQNEWDVTFNPDDLDADGCLILKRV